MMLKKIAMWPVWDWHSPPRGGPDTAQGRNHPYDGALWLKFHQHGHSYDTARAGRDLRQRSASVALHLGRRRGQAGSGACQGGRRLGWGLVHTFKLRDDAYFHHGRRMTADDIIWSYNRIMDGTKAYPGARLSV